AVPAGIFVGGEFTAVGTTPRSRLAAFEGNGDLKPWTPSANDAVTKLAISGDTVYAIGEFSMIGTTARGHGAALGLGGTGTLKPFDPQLDEDAIDIAVSDTTIYIGGAFSHSGAATREGIAAFDTTGALLPWDPFGTNGGVVVSLAKAGNTIYASGVFFPGS